MRAPKDTESLFRSLSNCVNHVIQTSKSELNILYNANLLDGDEKEHLEAIITRLDQLLQLRMGDK